MTDCICRGYLDFSHLILVFSYPRLLPSCCDRSITILKYSSLFWVIYYATSIGTAGEEELVCVAESLIRNEYTI
jgi:hypothetical protein